MLENLSEILEMLVSFAVRPFYYFSVIAIYIQNQQNPLKCFPSVEVD
jgi:hypothetical protein